jgi:hypothetical protein
MSGGNTTQELGQGVLMGGLLASNIMTGGADTPLDAIALGGDAAGGAFTAAPGIASDLFATAAPGGIADLSGSALTGANTLGYGANDLLNGATQSGTANMILRGGPGGGVEGGTFGNLSPQQLSEGVSNGTYTMDQANAYGQGLTNSYAQSPTSANVPGQASNTPWYQSAWNAVTNNPSSDLYNKSGMNLAQKGLLGGAGIATLLALQKSGAMNPNYLKPYTPVSASSMGLGTQMGSNYAPARASQWGYATGGVATPADVMPSDLQQQAQLPSQVQQLMSQYGVTPQEVSQTTQALGVSQPATKMAQGGITSLKEGSFVIPADVVSHFGNGSTDAGLDALHKHLGAHPIMGDGDGMSDSIPTTIDGKQPARVANGEALIHPERVKELGNGSSDVGAKKLYAMMDKVRKARTGNSKQGKQIKADKYLPT